MRQYHDLLRHILVHGTRKGDRTGTGTLSVFGYQMRFNLAEGFPLVTTKKIHVKSIIHELLWFLKGDTNIKYLNQNGVHIWDEWADEHGDLGPIYGRQWRAWNAASWVPGYDGGNVYVEGRYSHYPIDQIAEMMKTLKTDPDSRRMVVNSWNVGELSAMKLAPCHCLFQFYVAGGKLSCQLYQRSADVFLVVPFDIASYALLTQMVAQVCGLQLGEFIWVGGDTHLYLNHLEQVNLQLSREVRELPVIRINPDVKDIFAFQYKDFELLNYDPHPHIQAPVAV